MTRFRTATKTTTLANGTKVVRTKLVKAPDLEWLLQAAAVRRLRTLPGFLDKLPDDGKVPAGSFTFAGDFAAGRRGRQESVKAKATGLVRGEHDLRIFLEGGRLGLIEMKGAKTVVSDEQEGRHALLHGLGFHLQAIVRSADEDDAAEQVVAIVRGWLAANDNEQQERKAA